MVTIQSPGRKNKIVLNLGSSRSVRQSVQAAVGIMTIILKQNTNKVMYEPRERTVLVSSGSENEETYFQQLGLPRGQLQASCCTADSHVMLSCPGSSTETISLLSPCQWSTTTRADITRSLGSVFARSKTLTLPTSISGLRYRNVPGQKYQNSIRNSGDECVSCRECENSGCSCYTHTPQNTLEFLQTRALGFTYIAEIQKLLPSWLEMHVDLDLAMDSSPFTNYDLFAPLTRSTEEVSSIEGCGKLTGLMGSVFSVLRYDKTLSAAIDGERYTYSETGGGEGMENTMCFAVDMCQGLQSPVHMQISRPISDILASEYLRRFTSSSQWKFAFNTVSVYKNPILHTSSMEFWNGEEMIATPDIQVDVSVNADTRLSFSAGELNMRLEFSGDAAMNYEVSV